MDSAVAEPLTAADPLTLACALRVEARAAGKAGARTGLVGLGAGLPLPEGRLVSFGFAGGLADDLEPGALVTATRVVDEHGTTLWEGEPLSVSGARQVVVCATGSVANEPGARRALGARSGGHVADMESGRLAASGRLVGVVRAVSDTGARPVGALVCAGKPDGGTDWGVVARAFLTQPFRSMGTALDARKATAALARAARELA